MSTASSRAGGGGAYSDFAPPGWEIADEPDGYGVTLPGGHRFSLPRGVEQPLDWYQKFTGAQVSGRLWHRSLRYLVPIAVERRDWSTVLAVLRQVADVLVRSAEEPGLLGMNSLDHAITLQLRTACVLADALRADDTVPTELRTALESELGRLVAEGGRIARVPGFRRAYNHGLMLGLALLHVALVFGDNGALEEDVELIRRHLDEVLDEEGFAFENTPRYQRLYVDIVNQLAALVKETPHVDAAEVFARRAAAATSAYRRLVGPGGVVPARGDSPQINENEFEPLLGTTFSGRQGLYFRSDADGWMSFTCGALSPVHKQMDDTAVSLRLDGVDLLLDAGLYDYDYDNAESVGCRAQPGHSGLFFPSLDDKPQHWFYPADGAARVDGVLARVVEGSTDVLRARYLVEGGRAAERSLIVRSLWDFSMRDAAWSLRDAFAVRRFLVPEAARIRVVEGRLVVVEVEHLRMEISGLPGEHLDVHVTRGYEASQPQRLRPCWVLEFPIPIAASPRTLDVNVARVGR